MNGIKNRTDGTIYFNFGAVEMEIDMADEKKYETAREKLEAEKKTHSDDNAKVIIDHLIKRAEEDPGMSEDILQPHKTYRNCWSYIMDQAKKKLSNRSGAVRSDVVFEWAEDYYRLDDKAIAEKEKKEAAKQKPAVKQPEKKPATPKAEVKAKKEAVSKKVEKAAVRSADSKPKKKEKNDELDGQMDIFAFLGGA